MPILLIVYSLRTLFTSDPEAGFEVNFSGIFILLPTMVQTSYYASNRDEFYQMSFGAKVERFYNNGTRLAGRCGSSLVAMPLISVFQTFGTIVVLTALLLITVIYITDMTILEFFQTVFELIKRGIIGIVRGIRRAKMKRKERRQMKEAEEDKEPKEPKKPIPKLEGFEKTEESKTPVKGAFNIRILDSIRSSDFLDEEADSEPEPEAPKAEPILPKPKPSVVPVKEEKPIKSQSINILLPEKEQPKESVRQKLPEKPVEKPTENSVELKGTFYQYEYPKASLLKDPPPPRKDKDEKDVTLLQAAKLIETLKSFGVEAAVSTITKGPAIIRYELKPEAGIRAKRFTDLADDIALNLCTIGKSGSAYPREGCHWNRDSQIQGDPGIF